MAKGYRGARSKQYRIAKQSVMRALTSSMRQKREKETVQTAVDCVSTLQHVSTACPTTGFISTRQS